MRPSRRRRPMRKVRAAAASGRQLSTYSTGLALGVQFDANGPTMSMETESVKAVKRNSFQIIGSGISLNCDSSERLLIVHERLFRIAPCLARNFVRNGPRRPHFGPSGTCAGAMLTTCPLSNTMWRFIPLIALAGIIVVDPMVLGIVVVAVLWIPGQLKNRVFVHARVHALETLVIPERRVRVPAVSRKEWHIVSAFPSVGASLIRQVDDDISSPKMPGVNKSRNFSRLSA